MQTKMTFKTWLYLFSILTLAFIFANLGIKTDIIHTIFSASMPFIIGTIIAYILYLPAHKIEKYLAKFPKNNFLHLKKRILSIISVYILLFLIIYLFVKIISPVISESISEFIKNVPYYYQKLESVKIFDNELGIYLIEKLKNIDISKFLNFEVIFKYIKNTVGIAKEIFSIVVSLIFSVYLLLGRNQLLMFWDKQAKANLKEKS